MLKLNSGENVLRMCSKFVYLAVVGIHVVLISHSDVTGSERQRHNVILSRPIARLIKFSIQIFQ